MRGDGVVQQNRKCTEVAGNFCMDTEERNQETASRFALALLFPHPSTPVDDHAAALPAPSPLLHFIVVSSLEHSTPLRPPSFCCAAEELLQLTSRLAGSSRYLKCTFSPNTSFSFCCFSSHWLLVSYLGNAFHEKLGSVPSTYLTGTRERITFDMSGSSRLGALKANRAAASDYPLCVCVPRAPRAYTSIMSPCRLFSQLGFSNPSCLSASLIFWICSGEVCASQSRKALSLVGPLVPAGSLRVPGNYPGPGCEKTLCQVNLEHSICSDALGERYAKLHNQAVAVKLFSATDNARIAFCASPRLPKALGSQE
ncbi:hypothetical protein Anapl_03880 [Anas platyrhynchos]|uniref:Uncharacterized protein n=1 Tax=Anas platyrhynchos TaxID=8839 RepID=R0JGE4_ANAPL|nr:hypothetical protein Anapl_03880 [Anas platyrhynchos]